MIPCIIHPMIATKHKQSGLEMVVGLDGFENLLDNAVHLCLLGSHVRTGTSSVMTADSAVSTHVPSRPRLVSYVIKSKVVQDHTVPVSLAELRRDVPCHIVIHFREILVDQS